MNVLVYNGRGVSTESLYHTINSLRKSIGAFYDIKLVGAEAIAREPWEATCSLLILPGGRDLPYVEDLSGRACQRIRKWVKENNGKLLGICAGAYFSCSQVEFELGTPLEVRGKRELNLCPAISKGIIFDGFEYGSERGAHAALIKIENINNIKGMVKSYYNGGCWFDFKQSSTIDSFQIIGKYTERNDKPAIVVGKVNEQVSIILSGVHIEYEMEELGRRSTNLPFLEELRATETDRMILWHWILTSLGLQVREIGNALSVDKETPLYLLTNSSKELISKVFKANDVFVAEETTFKITHDNEPLSTILEKSVKDAESEYSMVIVHNLQLVRRQNWSFSPEKYFAIKAKHPINDNFLGNVLVYAEYINSTQTILSKNPKLASSLPNGTIVLAGDQLAGKGRGSNTWLSSKGCLQFTALLHHQGALCLTLVQYLVALAMVEAIINEPGYEALSMRLKIKWPNDLYSCNKDGGDLKKLGGILVNSQNIENKFLLLIGFGFNVHDTPWTRSLNDLVEDLSIETGTFHSPWTKESVLANFTFQFSRLYNQLLTNGFPFELYYKYWLHSNQIVFLEEEQIKARIEGIDPNGYLIAKPHSDGLLALLHHPSLTSHNFINPAITTTTLSPSSISKPFLLQPDGNSFDMMKNLIKRKQ